MFVSFILFRNHLVMTLFSQDPVFARGGVDERVGIFLSSQILWTGSASLLFLPAWFLDTLTQKSGWHPLPWLRLL